MYRRSVAFCLILATTVAFGPHGWKRCRLTCQSVLAVLRDEPARLSVASSTMEFATVAAGSPVRARFPVMNRGGKRLMLVREGESCECVAGDSRLALEPGEWKELLIVADSRRTHGAVELTVRYRTNDPSRPMLVLTLLGTVIGDVAGTEAGVPQPIPSHSPADPGKGTDS